MTIGTWTKVIIGVVIVGLAAWTTFAYFASGPQDTISRHVIDYTAQWPILGVAFGVLLGHWFWPQRPPEKR